MVYKTVTTPSFTVWGSHLRGRTGQRGTTQKMSGLSACTYYSLKGHLPPVIEVVPSYQYVQISINFSNLLALQLLYFELFQTCYTRTGHEMIPSSFHVGNELLEVKTKPNMNKSDTQTEFANSGKPVELWHDQLWFGYLYT